MAEIRNHLEHKYLKLHEGEWVGPGLEVPGITDTLALSVYRRDFEAKALRLLKLARAAMVYVVLAIRSEELSRNRERAPKGVRLPMRLDVWEDDWKR